MRVADVFAALRLDTTEFKKGLEGLNGEVNSAARDWGRSMSRFSRTTGRLGRSMTTNLTLPIIGAAAATSKLALDFDTSMRQIVALTDVTQDEIAGLQERILGLGGEVGKSPRELADAFYFVASAGFEAEGAFEVLEVSAKASAAGMGQTEDVAKALGAVINAYGHENLTAADAADQLTAAVGQGSAEAADFAGVLGRVAPIAASLGVGFDEVTAALAAMTNAGISADEGATSLRQVMVSLLKPAAGAEEAMRGLGLSSAGLRQQLREEGLLATLRTLEERFAGNDTAASAVFGNVRALTGVTALLAQDTDKLNGIFAATADSAGALEQAYEDTEGPGRELAKAMAELEAVGIELGTDVLPTVVDIAKELAKSARDLAKWWGSLNDSTKESIIQWGLWIAVAGPVLTLVSKLAGAFATLLRGVVFLTGARGVPRLIGVLGALRAAGLGVLGPIGLITAALQLAKGPIDDLGWDILGLSDRVKQAAKDIGVPAGLIQGSIQSMADEIGISFEEAEQRVFEWAEATGDSIQDSIEAVADGRRAHQRELTELEQAYVDAMHSVNETIMGRGGPVDAMSQLPPEIAAQLEALGIVVDEGSDEAFDPLAEEAAMAREATWAEIKAMMEGIRGMFTSTDAIEQAWTDFLERLENPYITHNRRIDIETLLASKRLREGLRSEDPQIVQETIDFVNRLLVEYEQLAPGALARGELVNPALQDGIDSNLGALLTYLENDVVKEALDSLSLEEAEELGLAGIKSYADGIERARFLNLIPVLTNLQRDAKSRLDVSLYGTGYNVGVSYGNGLRAARNYINDVAGSIRRSVGGHLEFSGSPPFTKSREAGEGVAESWWDAFIGEFQRGIPALRSLMGGVLPALTAPAMLATTATPVVAPTATAGDTNVTNNYHLTVGGVPYKFKTRDDFIDALDDLGGFGDGRIG